MLMSDNWIRQQCLGDHEMSIAEAAEVLRTRPDDWKPMIEPFVENMIRDQIINENTTDETVEGVISYGLGSYGYDARIGKTFKLFTNIHGTIVDPKQKNEKNFVEVVVDKFILIPPNSYALGHTLEYFRMPKDVTALCIGKSTYARSGIIINATPIEAGFEGEIVIEISNATSLPVKVYAGEGIAQFLFFKGDQPCKITYGDRNGKYQGQRGVTLSKV